MSAEIEVVTLDNFDINKVVFGEPTETFNQDKKSTGNYKCEIRFKTSKGTECKFILGCPEDYCYGFQKTYKWMKPLTPENFEGYQMSYYFESPRKENYKEQTREQKAYVDIIKQIEEKLVDHLAAYAEMLPTGMDEQAAKRSLDIKSILSYPKKNVEVKLPNGKTVTKEVEDNSKPLRMYARLKYYHPTQTFSTMVFGPGNRREDPLKYVQPDKGEKDINGNIVQKYTNGYIQPAFEFSHVFIGPTMKKVTFKVQLAQCTYKPIERKQIQQLVPINTAPLSPSMNNGDAYANVNEVLMEEDNHPIPPPTLNEVEELSSSNAPAAPKKVTRRPPPKRAPKKTTREDNNSDLE